MTTPHRTAVYWAPRALGLIYVVFLSLFALDVFQEGRGFADAMLAFGLHLLPALVMLIVVIIAWKHELAGAVLLTAAAIAYSVIARGHPSWIAVIAGPVVVLAALFVWSSFGRGRAA